jgi:hypothetical protein
MLLRSIIIADSVVYMIYQVPEDAADAPEQLGTKPKFWFSDASSQKFMFKEARPGTGEDWAEKVAAELCEVLELPHVKYELASWRDRRGVVTPMFVRDGGRLILGNELLGQVVPGYDGQSTYKQRQHTVRIVVRLLRGVAISSTNAAIPSRPIEDAADVFCGYLMLDALIGNTDRHHENWGLVLQPNQTVELAPTFDHASSLGREESDESRAQRLITNDRPRSVTAYAARARSALYRAPTDSKPLSTIDAFYDAAKLRPAAGAFWLEKLSAADCASAKVIFDEVPADIMSDTARQFALEILRVNRARLLERRGELT